MIEIRALAGPGDIDATDTGTIFGLAIPYNRETVIGDLKENGFREQIAPGSATKSLREADIVALLNHDSSKPLGRTSAGNLILKNTSRGVEPELTPSDTSYARDLATLVKDKVIRGWSFGFEVVRDDWTDDEGNPSDQWSGTNRTIREMKVAEVSPCTFPAYEMTNISSRDAVSAAREGRGEKRGEDRKGSPKPYGDVSYADPKNGKYPVDTEAHCKAAWAYINMPKNAAKYPLNGVSLSSVKSKIRAACAKFGIEISTENEAALALDYRSFLKGYDPSQPDGRKRKRSDGDTPEAAARRALKLAKAALKAIQRDTGEPMGEGTAKRVVQIRACLDQALECLRADKPDIDTALALIGSAAEHAGHIEHHEGIDNDGSGKDGDDDDTASARSQKTPADKRTKPKPDNSTSADQLTDDALRASFADACRREIDLGL